MTVFTYSQARQNFSVLLDLARKEGTILIKRKDGSVFSVKPDTLSASPLDVKGMKRNITTKEIVDCVRESRRRIG